MKKSLLIAAASISFVAVVFFGYLSLDQEEDSSIARGPAGVPNHYESLSACEKQAILWNLIESSKHAELPDLKKFGLTELIKLGLQDIIIKGDRSSDFAPKGWKKFLHAKGSVAKVKIVSQNSTYTGVFQGAECALLRLSLTYRPSGSRPVAPGLALKVLRDGIESANISALVSLDGQEKDFNFFKNPMSNIVPIGDGFGQKRVNAIFRDVSRYPEELKVNHMAARDAHGAAPARVISPRQLFFVPTPDAQMTSDEHDVRESFHRLPEGTVVYRIYASPAELDSFNFANYKLEDIENFVKKAQHIADIQTTSAFVSSEFGDSGLFFRHELRPK